MKVIPETRRLHYIWYLRGFLEGGGELKIISLNIIFYYSITVQHYFWKVWLMKKVITCYLHEHFTYFIAIIYSIIMMIIYARLPFYDFNKLFCKMKKTALLYRML